MFLKILVTALIVLAPLMGFAAIFQYTDERGVQHFTNIRPVGRKYHIIVPDSAKATVRAPSDIVSFYDSAAFDHLIQHHANAQGLDPSLVKAVMKAESNFNPDAVSPKGAQGLMQLMPGTARLMNIANAFNPEENIRAGTGYLKMLEGIFQGNVDLMLAAYNAGPTRVIEHNWTIPPIEETKNFVKRVKYFYNKLRNSNEG
jgi:soluble lytic murein transglycosylase-like protein